MVHGHSRVVILALCSVLASPCLRAHAEEAAELEVGSRIRVLAPDPGKAGAKPLRHTGVLVEITDRTVVLDTGRSRSPYLEFPRNSIQQLERSVHRGSRIPGVALGFFAGAATGAGVGYLFSQRETEQDVFSPLESSALTGVLFAMIGAFVGADALSGEDWEEVQGKPFRFSAAPMGPAGMSVAITGRF